MDKSILSQALEQIGVTLSAAIAAIFGAIASLAFAKNLTPRQAIMIVFAGIGTGSFGGGAIVAYLKWPPVVGGFCAFLLGVLAMPLLGAAFKVAERIRNRAGLIGDKIVDKIDGDRKP